MKGGGGLIILSVLVLDERASHSEAEDELWSLLESVSGAAAAAMQACSKWALVSARDLM